MTFLPRQSIHLFLCLIATIAAQKNGSNKITIKRGSKCQFGRGGDLANGTFKTIKMDESGDVDTCEGYARARLPKCQGFQVEGKLCHLLKFPVFAFKNMKTDNKQKRNKSVCARFGDKPTRKPTQQPTDKPVTPTVSPTEKKPVTSRPTRSPVAKTSRPTKSPVTSRPTVWHGKVFYPKKNVQCDVKPKDGFSKDFGNITYGACDNKCGKNDLCMAYTWVLKNKVLELGKCTTHNFWPNTVKKNKEGSYCVRVAKPTDAPIPSTPKPTNKPTGKPTSMTCNIQVTLGFPFKDPDDAPYYGQHADWIEVSKKDHKDGKVCSAYFESAKKNPKWCTYKNSQKDGDSAYVDNYEDEYYTDDQLKAEMATRETMIIKEAIGHDIVIEEYHWLFAEDYYPSLKTWNDHMMAAHLEITNLSHGTQEVIGDPFYQHPVRVGTRSHIKSKGKWIGNPEYKGNFRVIINCNPKCFCVASKMAAFNGFYE